MTQVSIVDGLYQALPTTLRILSVPTLEFVFFRLFIKHVLKIKIGYSFMTDFDVIGPALIACWLFITLLHRARPIRTNWRAGAWKTNGLLIVGFFLVNCYYRELKLVVGVSFMPLWYGLALMVFISGFFVMVPPRYYLRHPNRVLLAPAILMASSKLLFRHVLDPLWNPTALVTGHLVYGILKPFNSALTKTIRETVPDSYVHLSNGSFTLAVGSGCSGLEGISFLITAMIFTALIDTKRFSVDRWVSSVTAGALFFYLMNLARIVFVFLFSSALMRFTDAQIGVHAALLLFHNSIGWVLHGVGLICFYGYLYRTEVWPAIRSWRSARATSYS